MTGTETDDEEETQCFEALGCPYCFSVLGFTAFAVPVLGYENLKPFAPSYKNNSILVS